MNNFERFQLKNKQRASTATDVGNSSFIKKGFNSTVIECDAIKIQAAVVNQQNNDLAYIYTELKDTLEIGSCWTVKNLHLLVLDITSIPLIYNKTLRQEVQMKSYTKQTILQ